MKRLIGCTAALCLLALMVGCGGTSSTGTLAYISNSAGTGFTVFTVNTDGTLTRNSISPQNTPTPSGDGPKVLQFSANGKWAYFLDRSGLTIFAYTRAGNGTLSTEIQTGGYPTGPKASSLVITPNNNFLYVGLPDSQNLAIYSVDQSTGILSQVGSNLQLGYTITQLVIAPGGGVLYGLAPAQQAVLAWTINSSSGVLTGPIPYAVGSHPPDDGMILSQNGLYMYILDTVDVGPNSFGINTPSIYAYSVAGTSLTVMSGQPFHGNVDPINGTSNLTSIPVAGVTSNDNRYLFVTNQGSHNISVFKINSTTGEPTEVLGSTTTVNGTTTSTASPFPVGSTSAPFATLSFATVTGANNGLYVVDNPAGRIYQLQIDQNTGRLRAQNPAFVTAESNASAPSWITIR
jgi:6-phosphogluconolactonase (cycloisomerase 2 family)